VVKGAVIQAHTVEIKKRLDEDDSDLLAYAMADIRSRNESQSKEIILPQEIGDFFPGVKLTIPKKGDKKKLLDLSRRNALSYRMEKKKNASAKRDTGAAERVLGTLQSDLRLKEKPVHIECFDNSNIQGSEPVAACVVFKNGKPAKKEYRHYNIREVKGIDDFASMEEVVYRRYRRLLEEKQSLPQLVVIDGGKGQLNAALKSLDKLDIRGQVAIIGIAKKLEEIYFPDDPVPLYIDKNSESLKLIQFLRNEAHRFGIEFHRRKRSGTMTRSSLEDIPGVGTQSIERLFIKFKSVEGIRKASLDMLAKEIGQARALKVRQYFHNQRS
jgi:excinuclease ABC subunit C